MHEFGRVSFIIGLTGRLLDVFLRRATLVLVLVLNTITLFICILLFLALAFGYNLDSLRDSLPPYFGRRWSG